MRKLTSFLVFLLLFKLSSGQDSSKQLEFGSTLITVNSFTDSKYFIRDRPPVEYLNGIFIRYSKKRFGLRFITSYSENYQSYTTPPGFSEPSGGDVSNKDFRIGVGGQLSLLKKSEWLYSFLDISYRNVFSAGHFYGGFWGVRESYTSTANGLDCFFGLGFKIKTFKNVYLSPEAGYYSSSSFVNETTTELSSRQVTKFNYSETKLNPVIKLHLTVKF